MYIYIYSLLIHVTEIELFSNLHASQVCEGLTGHTEAVKVIYDKRRIPYKFVCDIFWESHDPTNKDYLVINYFDLLIRN
jgi:hypothetical protein